MSYTVTLDPGDGSTPNESLEVEILRDPPVATRSYNLLQGWFDSETGGNEIAFPYVPSADITLYARWLPEYLVSFSTNGGSSISSITAGYISEQPESTKSNYSLSGWSTSSDGSELIVFPYEVPEALTLYAVWGIEELPETTTYYDPSPASQEQAEENKLVNTALSKYPRPYLSGLKLNADIEINGLTLNTIDDNGVIWVVSDIDGWWNLPDSELPDLPRGWGDGSYGAVGRWATRIMTLSGSILTQTPEQAPIARDRLLEAISLIKTGGWLVVQEDTPKAAYVRLSGKPGISNVSPRGRIDFSIGLVSNDPVKYEWVDSTSDGYRSTVVTIDVEILDEGVGTGYYEGTASINNTGNIAVPIVIEMPFNLAAVGAGHPLPYIENSTNEQRITFTADSSTTTTSRLEIDTYNREVLEVTYNTGTVTNVANARQKVSVLIGWIYLEPGNNEIYAANFPDGTEITILYRSGWIG